MVLRTSSCEVSGKDVSLFSLRWKGYLVVNCVKRVF